MASIPATVRRVGQTPPTPCEFCSDSVAVLYCRADSAKLCLNCDRQVHSANALSRKHIRSQICDACGDGPATLRCSTEQLALCQDCDWDAHPGGGHQHFRSPLEGFSGCPPAHDIASIWGFDLSAKDSSAAADDRTDSAFANWETLDSILPVDNSWVFKDPPAGVRDVMVVPSQVPSVSKQSNVGGSSSGKCKQATVAQQLVELLKKDLSQGGDAGNGAETSSNCDLSPATPVRNTVPELGNGGDGMEDAERSLMQGTSYTSLLMWESNSVTASTDHASQIKEFSIGVERQVMLLKTGRSQQLGS